MDCRSSGQSAQLVGLLSSNPMTAMLCKNKYELKVLTLDVSIHQTYVCLENMHTTLFVTFSTFDFKLYVKC